MNRIIGFFLIVILMVSGCSPSEPHVVISVSEGQGLERTLTYVSANIPMLELEGNLVATDTKDGTKIPVQVLETLDDDGAKKLQVVFPVSMEANTSKQFRIDIVKENSNGQNKKDGFNAETLSFENETFKVLLSEADPERGGQITGIELKHFENQLLKRGHISMHWAPNFSKSDSEKYFNLENLPSTSKNERLSGKYQVFKERSGSTDSVPEIDVMGRYIFYEGLPYFHFESTMHMKEKVELDLLRNDEMTMDSLFTHMVFQENNTEPVHHELYGEDEDIFEGRNISDQADFIAFYHLEKGYGLASIRLDYDNTNEQGEPSPTFKPYTKVTRSSNNGRYWSRVLSDTVQTFPEGSSYHEKNVYLIFEVNKDNPEKEILYYQQRLRNPLKVRLN